MHAAGGRKQWRAAAGQLWAVVHMGLGSAVCVHTYMYCIYVATCTYIHRQGRRLGVP
jgi:hypothetical protein